MSFYTGRNTTGKGFEETEEVRRYLSNLIADVVLTPITNTSGYPIGMDSKSYFFTLPNGITEEEHSSTGYGYEPIGDWDLPAVWFITYESVKVHYSEKRCGQDYGYMAVIPARQDEYHKLKHNPFRGLNDRRALRFDLSDGVVEIVCNYAVTNYYVRYLRKPKPIILVDLEDEGLNIEGYTAKTEELEVNEALHRQILENAVILALRSRGYSTNNKNENQNSNNICFFLILPPK